MSLSTNEDISVFLNRLYEADSSGKLLTQVLKVMEEVYDTAPAGSAMHDDWEKINSEMTAKDAELIARARENANKPPEHTGAHGYEGWDAETKYDLNGNITQEGGTFEQMYGTPMISDKKGRYALNEIVLPGLGTLSKTLGKSIGDYKSILGDALGAMSNVELQKANAAAPRDIFDPGVGQRMHMNRAMNMLKDAGKSTAIGAVANDIGTGVGTYIDDIARANRSREEIARQAQLMINEHPVSDFWRDQSNSRNMRKRSPGGND